jgi:hypothetical protein
VIVAREKAAEKARERRRAFPIHFYSGRNGSGKSLTAVYDTMPTLDAGRPVLSTVRLLDWRNPRPCEDPGCLDMWHGRPGHLAAHPHYTPFTKWEQLLEWSFGDILMDEITGVADSSEHAAMPGMVANKLPQMRRDDVPVRITGLNWIRANKRLRESVNAVTRCRSSIPVRKDSEFGKGRVFRPRRLSVQITYDAQSLPIDDQTEHAYDQADKICKGRLWIPGCEAITAYDTFSPVLHVGTVTDSGRCAYCAGNRRPAECSCADYVSDRASRKAVSARRPLAGERGADSGRHLRVRPA